MVVGVGSTVSLLLMEEGVAGVSMRCLVTWAREENASTRWRILSWMNCLLADLEKIAKVPWRFLITVFTAGRKNELSLTYFRPF